MADNLYLCILKEKLRAALPLVPYFFLPSPLRYAVEEICKAEREQYRAAFLKRYKGKSND